MTDIINSKNIQNQLEQTMHAVEENPSAVVSGTITRISGMKIEAVGLSEPIGTICKITVNDKQSVHAEVVGFADNITYMMAHDNMDGIKPGSMVISLLRAHKARVGMSLLGRVLDANGNPIDGGPAITAEDYYSLQGKQVNPLLRKRIVEPLDVGIRAINALLTASKGQRLGIFSGSGVGKSVLLGMITRFTKADVVVVGLIGERGREVKEFIEESLGKMGLAKSVVIASPADMSPLNRVNGAILATTIAEYYRDQGKDVLLILDSLTRFAQAQREIALSIGEMPATKGFTPSVFAKLAQLVERTGTGMVGQGSITAFYTVLIEGDDINDPIGDHVRSLLDGHIFLSRQLADSGHYPAIDIERSISRVMSTVVGDEQIIYSTEFKKLYSAYMQNRELINVGMYQAGADRVVDEAIRCKDELKHFLMQGVNESASMEDSLTQLKGIFVK
jgi:flagellum-specific ATP synthase